jgi:CubicO group peptidase (beta-lactamase class C family)
VDAMVITLQSLLEEDRPHVYSEASGGVYFPHGRAVEYETTPAQVFDLASLTKGLFTAPRVFEFAAQKGILLHRPIVESASAELKKLLSPELLALSYADLLSHRSGLPAWMNTYTSCLGQDLGNSMERLAFHLKRVGHRTFLERGSLLDKTFRYSDVGFLLLGFILQIETKISLREQLLSMNQRSGSALTFSPVSRAASTGFCSMRQRELSGEVHDENCFYLGEETGHAGLFGTLHDVKSHILWLLNENFGRAFFHSNAILRRSVGSSHGDGLIGLRQGSGASAQDFCGGMSIGHLGFTGTAFWLDPETNNFLIHLTNRVVNGRLSKGIIEARQKFCRYANFELNRV